MVQTPECAMVLAAGLGRRMLPLTDTLPKPLVRLAGRPLIDHALDRLAAAGVARAVVNLHHHADQLAEHLRGRTCPKITFSDERDALLETGGGLVRAAALLGETAFFVMNSDTVWREDTSNLARLAAAWDDVAMDALLLLAPATGSLGYDGAGDYLPGESGRIVRRRGITAAPHVFAGVSINHPRLLAGAPNGAFSLTRLWDAAEAAGRLFGVPLAGEWMHVGTPQALAEAEARLAA